MRMMPHFENANNLSHICPYLEVRTGQGGVSDYVAHARRCTHCPTEGSGERFSAKALEQSCSQTKRTGQERCIQYGS